MDTLGNLLTSIRNAEAVQHGEVIVPFSKVSMAVLGILADNGYISSFSASEGVKPTITITLKQGEKHTYKRVSTPGRRWYTPASNIPTVLGGLGIVVISTSHGIMTGKDARKKNLGGEIICQVS